jgi:hypothetical protein
MSVEKVARDFVSHMIDTERLKSMVTAMPWPVVVSCHSPSR